MSDDIEKQLGSLNESDNYLAELMKRSEDEGVAIPDSVKNSDDFLDWVRKTGKPSIEGQSPISNKMTGEVDMIPCPFCGYEPESFEDGAGRVPYVGTSILTWGCEAGDECPASLLNPVPVEIWNKRVDQKIA